MANEEPMNDKRHDAAYHDAHLDDKEEWDAAPPEEVTPRPTGMTVFSLRLPAEEFSVLKQEAERRRTSMSELTRTALRFYLLPRAMGSLSATSAYHLQVTSMTPPWVGGRADAAQYRLDGPIPSSALPTS